jgi:predicted CXXCH cytochrome family protein
MKERMMVLIVLVAAVAMIAAFSSPVLAITGQCVNCHTMHNSQDGGSVAVTYDFATGAINPSATPLAQLLNADCVACHAGDTGTATNSFGAPIVLHTTNPNGQGYQATLAGGDFYWVGNMLGDDDATGHNVAGVSDADQSMPGNHFTPPGWDPDATPGFNNDGEMAGGDNPTWSQQLTCAGQYGCHGNHTDADPFVAIKGAHHGNVDLTVTQATAGTAVTVGGSYRFLSGIRGLENGGYPNNEWNWNETSAQHNEYRGMAGNSDYAYKFTISYSCAECHGIFHSEIGDASPWLRHPTDVVLPGDPSAEYSAYTVYSVEAPVARPTAPATSNSTVTPGQDIVMCLSCHRAHGSPEPDILRWTYADMQAGTGTDDTGCFTCHTTKNAS